MATRYENLTPSQQEQARRLHEKAQSLEKEAFGKVVSPAIENCSFDVDEQGDVEDHGFYTKEID